MGVGVDQAGGDQPVLGVDGAPGRLSLQSADGGDAVALDADVRLKPLCAGAIDDAAAPDHQVEHEAILSKPKRRRW